MYKRDLRIRSNWKLHRLGLSCGIPMDFSLQKWTRGLNKEQKKKLYEILVKKYD